MKSSFWTSAITDTPALRECDFSVSELGSPAMSDVFGYYDRIRSYIEHEDELINSRLTWSLTVHGFLFTIYGILVDKIAGQIIALKDNPDSYATIERAVAGFFLAQILIALFGALVALFSREAIVACHNSIQHLFAITQASILGNFTAETMATAAIAKGHHWVTPASMAGIVKDSLLLVDDGSERKRPDKTLERNEEIVSVLDVDVAKGRFEAIFGKAHKDKALIKALGKYPVMLPKVIAGGDKGSKTGGAKRYYLGLPVWTMCIWLLLLLLSLISGLMFFLNLY